MRIPESKWLWFPFPGHLIVGNWCRFHLCTQIGEYLISTVGRYVHPRHSKGSEIAEANYLRENPNGEEIGFGRHYETMVFKVTGKICTAPGCGCAMPEIDGAECGFDGYENPQAALIGHRKMCEWVASGKIKDAPRKPKRNAALMGDEDARRGARKDGRP